MHVRSLLGICLACLLLLYMSSAQAFIREYKFANDVSEVAWQADGDKYVCKIHQTIMDYGEVVFVTRAGRPTLFELKSWQGLPNQTMGRISLQPPAWRHNAKGKQIGRFKLNAGNNILTLDKKQTQNLLSALSSGFIVRLVYDIKVLGTERVTIDISPVAWQKNFSIYNQCLAKLLPYDFEDIRSTDVYFASNSEDLTIKARNTLLKLVRYMEAGADVSKLTLRGYTDLGGSYSHNRRLAGRRAEAVKAFLINNGIKPEMIEVVDIFGRYRLASKGAKSRRVNITLSL